MSLLIFAFVVLIVVALLVWALQQMPVDGKVIQIGSVLLILIAVLVIVQRIGVL